MDVYEFMTEDQQVVREKYVSLLAIWRSDLLYTADMLSALAPNMAAVAIKIPLHNLSWPACLNAIRVSEVADPTSSSKNSAPLC